MRKNVMMSIGMTMAVAALLLAGACGGGGESGSSAPAATGGEAAGGATQQAAPPSGGEAPSGTGSITGTVKFDGEAPKLRPIKMDADPGCAMKHSEDVYPETLVLGDGNTMGNVWVTIKSGGDVESTQWAVPAKTVEMDQRGCKYIPHVATVMAGQQFKFLNNDGVLHNVHALPTANKEFNKAMPATVVETDHVFTKPESMFKVKCDVHPWMVAYVAVTNHPFNAVTGKDGSFKIAGLKAGTYEVEAWHERLGTQTATVTVADGQAASQDFTFKK